MVGSRSAIFTGMASRVECRTPIRSSVRERRGGCPGAWCPVLSPAGCWGAHRGGVGRPRSRGGWLLSDGLARLCVPVGPPGVPLLLSGLSMQSRRRFLLLAAFLSRGLAAPRWLCGCRFRRPRRRAWCRRGLAAAAMALREDRQRPGGSGASRRGLAAAAMALRGRTVHLLRPACLARCFSSGSFRYPRSRSTPLISPSSPPNHLAARADSAPHARPGPPSRRMPSR